MGQITDSSASQKSAFSGDFWAGALAGLVAGGVAGFVLCSRVARADEDRYVIGRR